ncbi:hypothetical protein D3C75_962900 [compost metagenome]
MHMVRHQAPSVQRDAQGSAVIVQIFKISAIVIGIIEHRPLPMATLDDMVRLMRNEDSRSSGHGCTRENGTAGRITIARSEGRVGETTLALRMAVRRCLTPLRRRRKLKVISPGCQTP